MAMLPMCEVDLLPQLLLGLTLGGSRKQHQGCDGRERRNAGHVFLVAVGRVVVAGGKI
jgi:hypothetical protein